MLPLTTAIHLLCLRVVARTRTEAGQTSAEYALVVFGAASVALLVALWAKDTDRIGKLLNAIFDRVIKLVD